VLRFAQRAELKMKHHPGAAELTMAFVVISPGSQHYISLLLHVTIATAEPAGGAHNIF